MARSHNRPSDFIVYQDRPPYPVSGGRTCIVRVKKIPRGKSFHDVRDSLPASMGRMTVVGAYSAQSAKWASGITCSHKQQRGLEGVRRRRRR